MGNYDVALSRPAAAIDNYVKARKPGLADGLWGRPSGADWQLVTKAADCRWDLHQYRRALTELQHGLSIVPEDLRRPLALRAFERAASVKQWAATYRWLGIAHDVSGDDLNL